MRNTRTVALLIFPLTFSMACSASAGEPTRPAAWAVPQQGEGLSNFFKVTDNLYRGAQPSAEGMKTLEKLGFKTVINLRNLHDDDELLKGTALKGIHIDVNPMDADDWEEHLAFLKAATDPANLPVFLHCQHGADRTGMMIAVYRMAVQGWSRAEALREMTEGGYGFHKVWWNIVRAVKKVDVEKLRKAAGLPAPEPQPKQPNPQSPPQPQAQPQPQPSP